MSRKEKDTGSVVSFQMKPAEQAEMLKDLNVEAVGIRLVAGLGRGCA
jgi:hypothetical protein